MLAERHRLKDSPSPPPADHVGPRRRRRRRGKKGDFAELERRLLMPEGLGGLSQSAPPEGLEDYVEGGRLINRPPPLPNLRSPRQLVLSAAPTLPREQPKKLPPKATANSATPVAAASPVQLVTQLAQVAEINLDILPVISGGSKRKRP